MQRVMGRKGGEGEGPKTSENRRLSAFRPSLFKCRGTIMCGIWLDMIHYREKIRKGGGKNKICNEGKEALHEHSIFGEIRFWRIV